jgi:diguanylate cyclase (GGDEF)-like protein
MMLELDDEVTELHRIIARGQLCPVFQPIIDFRARALLGYEALIRGPEGGALHRPIQLFAAARRNGLGLELEHACREASLRAFARLGLPGRLFLNATPGCLLDLRMMDGDTRELLNELGLAPHRVIIELTENQSITDLPGMQEALLHYRSRGFKFAIDDLGEGFSNLRMWSEVRPEFVKIDKHFVNGIADDRMKFHFVRAMQDLAETCKSSLIAEGIERAEDFLCIRDMGIACGQGWFISRPAVEPVRLLLPHVVTALAHSPLSFSPLSKGSATPPTAGSLRREVEPLPHDANNEMAIARFEAQPDLGVLPVVNGKQPVGVINRHSMIDRFARPFRRELFGKKCCDLFMDQAPLIVDEHAGIQELAMMLALAPKHYMLDGFIITSQGNYAGIGSAHDLMATITEMQISAARYANPLTQLPGNVPINEHIDRMLASGTEFVAAYLDIDNFKPYNDTFGYRRGDDVIQLLSQMVCEAVDQRHDFVGHIGGDDFFVIFQSTDWEARCWQLVSSFAERVEAMTSPEESAHGGYMADNRRGEFGFQRLPTLSVGAVSVMPGQCESHREVAAAASVAKKQAKKRTKEVSGGIGGSVFIERRRIGHGEGFGQGFTLPQRQLN